MAGQIALKAPSGGIVTINAADTASNFTLTLPANTGEVVTTASTAIVTPAMLSAVAQYTGFKNRSINGGFIINQRAYVSGTALAAGNYAHDRYKAGSSGCTYTFTQGALGVNTTITITAGSLQQIIEGCNMPEGGTYVLSWTGSAQARFNSGTYGASPLAVTGITAGANVTIEFNTGTVGGVQIEVGVTATSFDMRDYGRELIMCQRYYQTSYQGVAVGTPTASFGRSLTISINSPAAAAFLIPLPVLMRAAPTVIWYNPTTGGTASPIRDETAGANFSTAVYGAISANQLSVQTLTNPANFNLIMSVHYAATAEL